MSTTKERINITTSKETRAILKEIAKRDRVPLATKAAELIDLALEIEEDIALGILSEERLSQKNIRWVPGSSAWK